MPLPTAVYVHIPFCEQICHYCDFNKVFLKGQPVDEYLYCLEVEMKETVAKYPFKKIETIYIGGGTPSVLTEAQLEKLLNSIKHVFSPSTAVEYTFEINPGNISEEKLAVLKNFGVNRLSIGVQAFQEELLKKIGRTHSTSDICETVSLAKKNGFENITLDLMFGLPGQTVQDFKSTIEQALEFDVPHFSAYSLKVEEKTVFHQLLRKGKLPLPSEEDEVAMYDLLIKILTSHNYHQYEISNFGKEGFESKHNLTYWNNNEYYGIGAGAHGYLGGERYANVGPVKKYIQNVTETGRALLEIHIVSQKEKLEEEMFLGLRKLEGVNVKQFINRFQKSPFEIFGQQIQLLKGQGLIQADHERISLTRKGLFVANDVFEKFLM